ncbi:septum formation protein [Paenibacillus sp. UNCCL117]|uniref:Maf family protein n=1 Tax=unclassified Paenibacillus TaxID=185978 RepID=UPI00088611CE|nr:MULTISPECIES: Maf family protein [unclassified Paenibacillus]SDD24672.1 septum formation protein [Paenibacillus sp. cl123]SFW41441.1 septum formation protein [Paenibacillus sp. UNCCL117]
MSIVPLILASSSPRRKELLAGMKLSFRTHPSDEDETVPPGTPPAEMVRMLALRKASSVAAHYSEGIVIGSDTIVVCDDEIMGKPADEPDACRMLARLSGRAHQVYTGVAIVEAGGGRSRSAHSHAEGDGNAVYLGDIGQYRILAQSPSGHPEVMVGHTVSKVMFRHMSDEEIEAYVKTGEPLDKAGSYGVQGLGAVFIEKIEGDFYSIMGLPINMLYQMLQAVGINPFQAK